MEAAAEAPASPLPTTMTSNFRLFAGLTSFKSNLCLSHFCATGPEGTFEFKALISKTSKLQAPSSNKRVMRKHLELDDWRFSGTWMLAFGASFQRLLSVTKQNRNRNRNVSKKNQPREDARAPVEARAIHLVLPTHRLKHAAHPVAQVQAQQRDADDIKRRHPNIAETDHHHFENIVPFLRI